MKKSIIIFAILLSALCRQAAAASYSVTVNLNTVSNDYMTAYDYIYAQVFISVTSRWSELSLTNWYASGSSPGSLQSGPYAFIFSQVPDYYQPGPYVINLICNTSILHECNCF